MSKTKTSLFLGLATAFLFFILPFFIVQAEEKLVPIANIPPNDQCCFYTAFSSDEAISEDRRVAMGVDSWSASCAHEGTSVFKEECGGEDADIRFEPLRCNSIPIDKPFKVSGVYSSTLFGIRLSPTSFITTIKLRNNECLYDDFTFKDKQKLGFIDTVDIKSLPADKYCCFSYDHFNISFGDSITERCADQSLIEEKQCPLQHGTDQNITQYWTKCNSTEELLTIQGGKKKPILDYFSVSKCYNSAVKEITRNQVMNDNCCFCGTTEPGDSNICLHQNIVSTAVDCRTKCNAVDYSAYSFGNCIDDANIITGLNKLGGKYSSLSDKCYFLGEKKQATSTINMIFNVAIPGSIFNNTEPIPIDDKTLSRYLAALYKFLAGIASILAVFMIAYGGFLWLFSDGAGDKVTKAKEVIIAAISGLVLMLGSYMLLNFINPALVGLKFPTLPIIEAIKSPATTVGFDAVTITPNQFPGIDLSGLSKEGLHLDQITIDKLNNVVKILKKSENQGITLKITSAFRSATTQQVYYNKYVTCKEQNPKDYDTKCTAAAKPDANAPHMQGLAVDVCIIKNGVDTCSWLNTKCNGIDSCELRDPSIPPKYVIDSAGNAVPKMITAPKNFKELQVELQNIMKEADFIRYCGEWWHFESRQLSKPGEPGDYSCS